MYLSCLSSLLNDFVEYKKESSVQFVHCIDENRMCDKL